MFLKILKSEQPVHRKCFLYKHDYKVSLFQNLYALAVLPIVLPEIWLGEQYFGIKQVLCLQKFCLEMQLCCVGRWSSHESLSPTNILTWNLILRDWNKGTKGNDVQRIGILMGRPDSWLQMGGGIPEKIKAH